MRLPLLPAAVCFAALFAGCGTVITGPLQKVSATSRPAGAEVLVDGMGKGVTPTDFELSRWQDHDVTISLRGYQPFHLHMTRRVNPWIAMNIANGFILGVIVDESTGAIYKLDPPTIQADLFPRGVRRRPLSESERGDHASAPAATGGRLVISTTLRPDPRWSKIGQMEKL